MHKTWKIVWTIVGIAVVGVAAYYVTYWLMSAW